MTKEIIAYFNLLETELSGLHLNEEVRFLNALREQVAEKTGNAKFTRLRVYLNTFDSVPFFDEDKLVPTYKDGEIITLDGRQYTVREIEKYDLTLEGSKANSVVRLVVNKNHV